jgi:hypothetical protein
MTRNTELIDAFRHQSRACGRLGSRFMALLLDKAAEEIEQSGSIAGLLAAWPGDPVADAVPLRLAAALHAQVLSGAAPELAALYPPAHQAADASMVWHAALSAITTHRASIEDFLASPPQTNEVGRSAVLLGGFLEIARATGVRPMQILEIGASAGLNQPWDRYRYELGGVAHWGDPDSPVAVTADWSGPLPPLETQVVVAKRAASDAAPVDLDDPESRLRLRAYVWADQPARMALLDAAIALVRQLGLRVEQGEAAAWVLERLRDRAQGVTTVLYHSIAWDYFPEETKAKIQAAVQAAGQRADAESPFAWLRLEPPSGGAPGGAEPELRLTLWPGGREQCLAHAHTHGPPVHWLAEGSTRDE